ncbi:hypothetical protein [Lentzea sp. HUAS12]|uniref:hypothetical protein n=1 Tax=Lentzea sp. HUAS12 TaxID=2951806 RepID=UPI00209EAC9C|nr:hypothetical protein [Lentzea sp. HUAS12]USX53064.1 hypothetical protein ND450_02910 [Lentzea sp. HUAS12]
MGCTTFTASAAVAAEQSACEWVVSDVPVPSGHDPKFTTVKGTDSFGNYSGNSRREGTGFTFDAVIWTGGQPRVLQAPGDLTDLQVIDENRSGTVLLFGRFPDRTATLLYKDAHEASGTITELPGLEGYQINPATALNERGDVLGNATSASGGDGVGLLWPATGGAPQVIERSAGLSQDLDDDGTVLLRHPSSNGGRLWRNGVVTELAHEGKRQYVQAIRGGKVVGYQFEFEFSSPQGLLWDGNGAIKRIAGAASAYTINGGGLVTGQRGSLTGKAAIWRDTRFMTELPLPNGVSGVSELFVAGDDETLFSKSGSGPLRWSCE